MNNGNEEEAMPLLGNISTTFDISVLRILAEKHPEKLTEYLTLREERKEKAKEKEKDRMYDSLSQADKEAYARKLFGIEPKMSHLGELIGTIVINYSYFCV